MLRRQEDGNADIIGATETVQMKKHVFCGSSAQKKTVTFTYDESDKYLFVEHVPAEVCTRCSEKMYSPEVTDELLEFAKDKFKPLKTVKVPVFDFAAHQ